MPIYEYQCQACGHQFETIQKISDPVLTDCPRCAAAQLKKRVSLAAFRLKGGGWYETDFKSGTRRNVAGEAKDGGSADSGNGGDATAAKTDGSGNGAKDSKPAAGAGSGEGGKGTKPSSAETSTKAD
jgi:putative FmdB family regulatory protein